MRCLQKLLAGLMLFLPAIYALATRDQADIGKVRGFTGLADEEPTGDYLTATYCYCKTLPEIEEVLGLAHYYQFEYYNRHLNNTFILTSKCPKDVMRSGIDCVPPSGGEYVLAGDNMWHENCNDWPGSETVRDWEKPHRDKFCYKPRRHHGDDFIYFNKQKRNLGRFGSQGPVWQNKTESEKVCEGLCQEHWNADLLRDDTNHTPSHQVIWTDLGTYISEIALPLWYGN